VASWGPPQTTGKLKFGKGPLTDGLYHYQSEVQATIDFGFDVSTLPAATVGNVAPRMYENINTLM
jgi:hypothetical protein